MLQVSLFKKQAYRTIILYIQTDPYQCVEGGRGDAWVVSSNHHPEALFLASAVARDTFLKLIRERLCGGEDVDSWYGFQRNISNDHS